MGLGYTGSRPGAVSIGWSWSADLDTTTLYGLLRLRAEAFIVGQHCAYQDLDGRDLNPDTRHFWIKDPDGIVVSGLRVLADRPETVSGSGGYAPPRPNGAGGMPHAWCVPYWQRSVARAAG